MRETANGFPQQLKDNSLWTRLAIVALRAGQFWSAAATRRGPKKLAAAPRRGAGDAVL